MQRSIVEKGRNDDKNREEQGQQQAREEHSQRQAKQTPKDCDRDKARYEEKCAVQSKVAATHPTSDADVQQQSIQSASQSPDVQQGQYELKLDEEITTIPKIDFNEEILEYEKIIPTAQKLRFRKSRRP